jgi:hypothetical protein
MIATTDNVVAFTRIRSKRVSKLGKKGSAAMRNRKEERKNMLNEIANYRLLHAEMCQFERSIVEYYCILVVDMQSATASNVLKCSQRVQTIIELALSVGIELDELELFVELNA